MPDTAHRSAPPPTWTDHAHYPDTGIGQEVNIASQQYDGHPAASYFPVQTPQQSIQPWNYGSGLGELIENHEVDEYPRNLPDGNAATGSSVDRPAFLIDYVRVVDYEVGGEAGKVNRNPYTMGAVVPFEDFDLTGVVARIRRRPEGTPNAGGPVRGLSASQGSAWDVYAAQLDQSRSVTPSNDEIAMSLLGARGSTSYDDWFPA